MSEKLAFASAVLTALKDFGHVAELTRTISDPMFAAKAALYARRRSGLRSVSHVVAGELAKRHIEGLRSFYKKMVHRPDDITETLAYLGWKNIPNAMKRGFGEALSGFDAYQLAKYRRGNFLVDAVNLCHPKSTEALSSLVKGTLAPAETWESGASWADLLAKKKLGYLAALRNLRRIPDDLHPQVIALLTDPEQVAKSMVLPFQFLAAHTPGFERALNTAMELSLRNVPVFDGATLIAVDNSGSMMGRPIELASMLAAVLFRSQKDVDMMVFSDTAHRVYLNPVDSIQTLVNQIQGSCQAGGTNFHSIFQGAQRNYDRIVILSDMEAWMGYHTPAVALQQYKARFDADPQIYSFNLNSTSGTMQFPEKKVFSIAGFSDAILQVMAQLEEDPKALVHAIEAVEL